jgi:pimeloyl-ACP methyl ester carboxylesterase
MKNLTNNQGASVSAAFIARQQLEGSFEVAPFKMAVFLCAALIQPEIATANQMENTMGTLGYIDIPTVHVIGRKDLCEPQSRELVKLCSGNVSQVLVFDGGHDIPRDVVNAKRIALAIEQALRLAFTG